MADIKHKRKIKIPMVTVPWRLHIKDKTKISGKNGGEICCPVHHFPHKLPGTGSIPDEPCHYHDSKWRMAHHIPTCRIFRCPHRKHMLEEYRKIKNKTK